MCLHCHNYDILPQAPSVSSKHGIDEMEAEEMDTSRVIFDFDQGFQAQGFTQEQVDGKPCVSINVPSVVLRHL